MSASDKSKTMAEDNEAPDKIQRWIDDLLRSSEAAELECAPASMRSAAMAAVVRFRHRQARRRLLVGVAAAAAIVGAFSLWPRNTLPPQDEARTDEGLSTPIATLNSKPRVKIRHSPSSAFQSSSGAVAKFESAADSIAVPVASEDSQVSIVQLYPTTSTERRWRRDLVLQTSQLEPRGG